MFRIRIRIDSSRLVQDPQRDADPDPGGQNNPQISCFEVQDGCFLLEAEGFSCSLDVLYGGLEVN